MALVVPLYFSGEGAPLLRGVWLVAVPLWGGLACAAAVLLGRSKDFTFRHREIVAAALVLALGGAQITRGVLLAEALARSAREHLALAKGLNATGRNAEALAEARRAIEAGAGREAKLLAAALLILQGDLGESEALLGPLVAADARDADAQYDLGLCADKRGDDVAARRAYTAALKADPGHYGAHFNLALVAWRAGSLAEARDHVQKLRQGFPGDVGVERLAQTIAGPPPPGQPR
jgi:tetratricopeptide (TPR) repeat protein